MRIPNFNDDWSDDDPTTIYLEILLANVELAGVAMVRPECLETWGPASR